MPMREGVDRRHRKIRARVRRDKITVFFRMRRRISDRRRKFSLKSLARMSLLFRRRSTIMRRARRR